MIRPRRAVKLKTPRRKREPNAEDFDSWLKRAAALKTADPARYERETKDVVKFAVENYERVTKGCETASTE